MINQDFPYSYGSLFILDKGAKLPDLGWSAAHDLQGFSRGPGCLQIATLTQWGSAELHLTVDHHSDYNKFVRVIEIPLEVKSGTIEVGTVDSASEPELFDVIPGQYKVVVAQLLLEEDEELNFGKELIEICFHKLHEPMLKSRILVCDDGLDPPKELLETLPKRAKTL